MFMYWTEIEIRATSTPPLPPLPNKSGGLFSWKELQRGHDPHLFIKKYFPKQNFLLETKCSVILKMCFIKRFNPPLPKIKMNKENKKKMLSESTIFKWKNLLIHKVPLCGGTPTLRNLFETSETLFSGRTKYLN